ncbi:MAG: sugar ABC transporter permease [Caldilineaceae bacterium]|nr:sugar ABC transporter permease [Caldilineaceae bacterium]
MSTEIKEMHTVGGQAGSHKRRHSRIFWRDTIEGYLFISPVILGLMIWTFGPMLASFYLSLTDYPLLKAPEFIGLRNYVDIFSAAYLRVLDSLWVTLKYAAISLPITLIASLAAAVLLNQRLRGMNFFRTAFYLPTIVPSIAMVFVWGWLLNPEFDWSTPRWNRSGCQPYAGLQSRRRH